MQFDANAIHWLYHREGGTKEGDENKQLSVVVERASGGLDVG